VIRRLLPVFCRRDLRLAILGGCGRSANVTKSALPFRGVGGMAAERQGTASKVPRKRRRFRRKELRLQRERAASSNSVEAGEGKLPQDLALFHTRNKTEFAIAPTEHGILSRHGYLPSRRFRENPFDARLLVCPRYWDIRVHYPQSAGNECSRCLVLWRRSQHLSQLRTPSEVAAWGRQPFLEGGP